MSSSPGRAGRAHLACRAHPGRRDNGRGRRASRPNRLAHLSGRPGRCRCCVIATRLLSNQSKFEPPDRAEQSRADRCINNIRLSTFTASNNNNNNKWVGQARSCVTRQPAWLWWPQKHANNLIHNGRHCWPALMARQVSRPAGHSGRLFGRPAVWPAKDTAGRPLFGPKYCYYCDHDWRASSSSPPPPPLLSQDGRPDSRSARPHSAFKSIAGCSRSSLSIRAEPVGHQSPGLGSSRVGLGLACLQCKLAGSGAQLNGFLANCSDKPAAAAANFANPVT